MRSALIKEMRDIKWRHSIELEEGLKTPGQTDPRLDKLDRIGLADDLSGKSVIDIGAWDGFFSFEAERRGADDVFAIDDLSWDPNLSVGSGKRGFDFCVSFFNSHVRSKKMSLYELDPEIHGKYDIVLLLGVLYHLKYPFLGIEKARSVCKGMIILETYLGIGVRHVTDNPVAEFYEGAEKVPLDGHPNNDPNNWWGPNDPCVMALMRAAGFQHVKRYHVTKGKIRATYHGFTHRDNG